MDKVIIKGKNLSIFYDEESLVIQGDNLKVNIGGMDLNLVNRGFNYPVDQGIVTPYARDYVYATSNDVFCNSGSTCRCSN